MKRKLFILALAVGALACLLATSALAAEPSTSDDFGEVTIVDALSGRSDYGYADGDTARVVLQIPGTQTYVTYPMYYCFGVRNDGQYGMQPTPDFGALSEATGYAFDVTSVIRLEIPGYFTAVSTNYTKSNTMTNLKYVKINKNFIYLHSSAFSNLKSLEEVVFEENPSTDISLVISSKVFEYCTALTTLNLPSQVTSLGERSVQGCTALTTVNFGSRLTATGTAAFLDCTALATINIPKTNALTRISHRSFENCESLTGTYVFNNVTHVESAAFRYCSTNEGTYLSVSFPAIVDFGCSGGDSHVFSESGVCEVSLGENLSAMTFNTFTKAKRLWRVEFAGVAEGFEFKGYTFEECSGLKAVSLPEGITKLPSRMFKYCTALTAVYIPSTVTSIDSGDNDHATFKGCTSLYFVAEPFTYKTVEEIPAEPTIYKFPSGITNISSEAFDNSRINDVVVLPVGVTSLTQGYTFEGCTSKSGNPTVVFLGDMTTVNVRTWGVSKIYFCNPADVDYTSAGATNDSRMVFCYAEGNTSHIKELSRAQDATCTLPKMTADFCFCGQFIPGTETTEGVALGHALGQSYHLFTSLTVAGKSCADCSRCDYVEETEHSSAVYVSLGYSVKTYGTTLSFSNGYRVDVELLSAYESTYGVTVSFGFAFNLAEGFDGENATLDSFKINAPVANRGGANKYGLYEYVMRYSDSEHLDTDIVIGAYVIEKGESGETLTFINKTEGGFEVVSYNSLTK